MINEPLNKKDLIKKVYKVISNQYGFTGDKLTVERCVENVIAVFTEKPGNRCYVCNKPNWELLASEYGMAFDMEFENGKCGYCKLPQPIKTHRWLFTQEEWRTL